MGPEVPPPPLRLGVSLVILVAFGGPFMLVVAISSRSNLWLLCVFSGLFLALSLLLGELWVARRVAQLTRAARRATTGDAVAFDELRREGGEFGKLSDSLARVVRAVLRADQEQRFVLNSVKAGVIAWDGGGKIRVANRAAGKLLGSSHRDLMGKFITQVWDLDDTIAGRAEFDQASAQGEKDQGDSPQMSVVEVRQKNGTRIAVEFATKSFDPENGIGGGILVFRERGERTAKAAMAYQASHDSLTNLPNRGALVSLLQETINRSLAKNPPSPNALLILDIDRFKEINNAVGHAHGDLLLAEAARRIHSVLDPKETVARLGGDEFAVLLPGANWEKAKETADRILNKLSEPFELDRISIDVAASLGIALYPEHGDNSEALIRGADIAMYVSKRTTSGASTYSPQSDSNSPRRLTIIGDLRQAIEHGGLVLHYQPQVSLRAGRLVGAEALVRWNHPSFGPLSPDQFIGLAEQTGLIRPLTFWALDTALAQRKAWEIDGPKIPIAVNLSPKTLQDGDLCQNVALLLKKHGLDAKVLELEITESAIMGDPARSMDNLLRLGEMGIQMSIDDFGTGYSSMGRLRKLPVDTIKIDKSFVLGMTSNEDDAAIVMSMIEVAHNLGLKVIAEGVETRESMNRLMALGCDSAQGYLISRPVAPADFMAWWMASPYGPKGKTERKG